MNRFTFIIPIDGTGDTPAEAWEDAMERLNAALFEGEYENVPDAILTPAGPLLSPIAPAIVDNITEGVDFGIDRGPEEE